MRNKKILVVDEEGFTRVCRAILELEGHLVESLKEVDNLSKTVDLNNYGLIITSYPYADCLFETIQNKNIPVLVLSDHISKDLIKTLGGLMKTYCMVKPLDYQKFRVVVGQMLNGIFEYQGGYEIV